jgi:hypothetical protein
MPRSAEREQKGVHGIAREDGRERPDALQCELVCIPPDRVHLVWPRVAGLIEAAMRRGDLSSFAGVQAAVSGGHALLWVAWDGDEIAAAAVTELHQTEWRKVCVIVACGGSERERWLELIEPIEEFARAEGCGAMRIMGRKGWARVLPKYRIRRVVLEKEL